MATVAPPPSKRQKREVLERSQIQQDVTATTVTGSIRARFLDSDGKELAETVEIPLADATERNVSTLLNTLLQREREDFTPYRFRIQIPNSNTVIDSYPTPTEFLEVLRKHGVENPFETTISLTAEPQSVFKVQAATRMAHRIPGHGQPILTAQFSPKTGSMLATGSGDSTARIWNTETGTPKYTLQHSGWVLVCSFDPTGTYLATGSMDKMVRLWNPDTGKQIGKPFTGHTKWITSIAWQPYHLWGDDGPRLASASKDATVRIYMTSGVTHHVLSGHKSAVTMVRWGGLNYVYTASQDKQVKVWNALDGTLRHSLNSHAHWVNHITLSTDSILRTAYHDHTKVVPASDEEKKAKAKARFEKAATQGGKVVERLVSASDDCTVFLWDPETQGSKPVTRLLGHQKQINFVGFSPDGRLIATASFDNSIKVFDKDGKFLASLRGHVAPVFQLAFSADSRLLASCSRDTTVKTWDMRTFKLKTDLPGHEDEVWALDWSPDGACVASGGKDKAVRVWRH
ncbi:soluble quino protein glucose/sorbosone dehydrogenase [Astrocystis sublimbata]|nr:soluble quino protein glucose/sorbosone dehydrogenase [Astrocystis sublimbata]